VQDKRLDDLFGQREEMTGSWVNHANRFVVASIQQTRQENVELELSDGYRISIFPASCEREAWRLFKPNQGDHLVFPAI
jgi:hypothetical protein